MCLGEKGACGDCQELRDRVVHCDLYEVLLHESLFSAVHSGDPVILDLYVPYSLKTHIKSLVSLAVTSPWVPDCDSTESKRVYVASQLLCTGGPGLVQGFFKDGELLALLFSVMETTSFNPVSAGYLAEIVANLMSYKAEEVVKYLFITNDFVPQFLQHLSSRSLSDSLLSFLKSDSGGSQFAITKMRILESLISQISQNSSISHIKNAGEIVLDMIENGKYLRGWEIYMALLLQSHCSYQLITNLTSDSLDSVIISAEIVTKLMNLEEFDDIYEFQFEKIHRNYSHLEGIYDIFELIDEKIAGITASLRCNNSQPRRLIALTRFLSSILQFPTPKIERNIVNSQTLATISRLFVGYPWVSFLHTEIYSVIHSILNSHSSGLKYDLLVTHKFPVKLMEIAKNGCKANKGRLGNLGYVTKIGNLLVEVGESQPFVAGCLEQEPLWTAFCEVLRGRNEVERGKLEGSRREGGTGEELYTSFVYWSIPPAPPRQGLTLD